LAISQITYMEVLSFPFDSIKQENEVQKLLEQFKIYDIDKFISKQVIKNRKLKKIKISDNIIASTAQINNLILVSRNIKDFTNLDVNLLNPFD